jgi:ankyrin repeat protein
MEQQPQRQYDELSFFETARSGRVEIVRRCLDYGVSVDATNVEGKTALYYASLHGHVEMARLLVQERGANVNFTTTATTTTTSREETTTNYSCLQAASQEGHVHVMQLLLEAGAHVHHCDQYGDSALHDAVHYNQIDAAECLLDYGANLLFTNHQGLSALDLCPNEEVKERLRQYSPLQNLHKKLQASNQSVHELRQEVHLLKNLLLATAFGGSCENPASYPLEDRALTA